MILFAENNYQYNQTIPLPTVPVNGQALGAVSGVKFGVDTLGKRGCGVITVFNALALCGVAFPLAEVTRFMERYRLLWGLFGVNFFALGRAMRHFGVKTKRIVGLQAAQSFLQQDQVMMMAYWTKKPFLSSAHIVCLCGIGDGMAKVYNRYNRHPSAVTTSLEELYLRSVIVAFGVTSHNAARKENADE